MPLHASFRGHDLPPFEGDRVVELLGLPSDARVVTARATVFPDWPQGDEFREKVVLTAPDADRFGMTVEEAGDTIVADFHARRLLRTMTVVPVPSALTEANVYLDLGGMWVAIRPNGSLAAPGDPPGIALPGFALPDVATSRVRVVVPRATGATLQSVSWRTFPSNVSLRLGAQGPFFVRLGDLTVPAEIPDFAAALSAYLSGAAAENGHFVVPITLHSDGLARLGLVVDVDYVRERSLLPPDVRDIALPFSYERTPDVDGGPLLAVTVAASEAVSPAATQGRVVGRFDETRIALGPEHEPVPRKGPQRIGAGVTQAQPIRVALPLAFTALDLLVEPLAERTELTATILDDADGKPWGAALLPEPVRFSLRREVGGGYRWESAPLPGEFQLAARRDDGSPRTYWLVISAEVGSANWATAAAGAAPPLYRTVDDGLSWQEAQILRDPGPLSGIFRLRHVPPQFEMPVELQVGDGEHATVRSLDRFAASGRVDFSLGDELAEAVNEYTAAAGPAACPEAEHLANGDFSRWLRVDPASEVPEDWTVVGQTARQVLPRFVMGAPVRQAALVISPEDRTGALSQVTACAGGCTYRFEFLGLAEEPGAQAQIIWRDVACGAVRIDALELHDYPTEDLGGALSISMLQRLEVRLLHRLTVVAPATATQAEARFLVPPGNQIVVGAVSLAASTDLISNSDLAVVGDDGIIGWDAPLDLAVSSVEGTVLHNLGGEVATAAQQVTVAGGSSYVLEFTGRALAPDAAAPRIELAWADSAGTAVGKAVVHDVDVLAMDRHLIEGVVPDGAAAARIALVLPPSARLEVHRVSLRTPHCLQVPVYFRAHSPGQLIVSGAAVGLEEVEPAAPPIPASGLCSPTPPGGKPGHEPASYYCPACGAQSSLRKATPAVTSAGRPAALAKCEHCKAEVVTLGGRLEPDAISLRQRRNTSVDFHRTANQPVVVVDGIGPARSAQLAALGITRIGHLAAAPIEWLVRAKSLSLTGAREIRNEARGLLFHTDTAPATPHRRL